MSQETGDRNMQANRLMLIATLTLGMLMTKALA